MQNCFLQAISLFLTMFSTAIYLKSIRVALCGNGLNSNANKTGTSFSVNVNLICITLSLPIKLIHHTFPSAYNTLPLQDEEINCSVYSRN